MVVIGVAFVVALFYYTALGNTATAHNMQIVNSSSRRSVTILGEAINLPDSARPPARSCSRAVWMDGISS